MKSDYFQPLFPPGDYQKESHLEQVTRFLGEGVLILDPNGRLTFMNSESERILGWKQEELIGSTIHNKIHYQNPMGEPIPREQCPVHKCIQDGQVYQIKEDFFIHQDGRIIPVSFVSAPIWKFPKNNSQLIGSVTIFREISKGQEVEREIKQARDIALETARLKSEFLANMSHEIRTPINGVIGMTELLLDSKLNKEQKELASIARESAQALLTMVNDILDFSRLESGKLEVKSDDFRPLKVVEEVAELLGTQAQGKNLDLLVDVSNKIPNVLKGDPARIRHVLVNLVGNALKFTKKGEVIIRVRQEIKNKSQVILRFSIADTGIGIPKSARHRLFQPFTQVDGSSTRKYGGVGLGLSISSRLVELMGGQIGCQSRKGKGSTFWFSIPLARSTKTENDPFSSQTSIHLQGIKALVVDPHQTSQTILLNHLLRWKIRGTAVESQEEALSYLEHEAKTGFPCSLVLVSSSTTSEPDFPLAQTIRQTPYLNPIHLVLLTGISDNKFLQEAKTAGYTANLSKPIQRNRLLECLLSLPTLQTEHSPQKSTPHHTLEASRLNKPEGGNRILLAEDNAVIQKVAQIQLQRLGYAVHIVANGKEAVQFMETGNCSLILMDCHMPILDGYQATSAIRALQGEQAPKIPIIGMSAKALKGDPERCLEVGMDDVLTKPVQIENLAKILNRWLPREKALESNQDFSLSIEVDGISKQLNQNRGEILEFLELYLTSASDLLTRLSKHLKQKNRLELTEKAHELTDVSMSVGAIGMAKLCRQLESHALENDWNRCKDLLGKMDKELEKNRVFVANY